MVHPKSRGRRWWNVLLHVAARKDSAPPPTADDLHLPSLQITWQAFDRATASMLAK